MISDIQNKAHMLREDGLTFSEIGSELNISANSARLFCLHVEDMLKLQLGAHLKSETVKRLAAEGIHTKAHLKAAVDSYFLVMRAIGKKPSARRTQVLNYLGIDEAEALSGSNYPTKGG